MPASIDAILESQKEYSPDAVKSLRAYFEKNQAALLAANSKLSTGGSFEDLIALGVPPGLMQALESMVESYYRVHPEEKPISEVEEGGHGGFHMGGGHPEEPDQVRGDLMKNDEDYKKIKQELEDKEKLQKALRDHEQTLKDKLGKDEYENLLKDQSRRGELKEELAEAEFRKKHEDKAKEYDKLEQKQVYLDPKNDPLYQKKQKEIEAAVEKEYRDKIKKNPQVSRDEIRRSAAPQKWDEFVEKYKDKAVYGASNPEIEAAAHRVYGGKKFKNKDQDPLYQIATRKAHLEAQRTIAQKTQAGETLSHDQKIAIQKEVRQKHLVAFARKYKSKEKYGNTDLELRRAYTQAYPQPTAQQTQAPQIIQRPIVISVPQTSNMESSGDSSKPTPPQFEDPSLSNPVTSTTQNLAQNEIQRRIKDKFKKKGEEEVENAAEKVAQKGVQRLLSNLAGRIGVQAIFTTAGAFFSNPVTLAVLAGIVIFLIIVVIILIIIIGIDNAQRERGKMAGSIPGLTLEKQGPSQVENEQDIPYTISVTYRGNQDVTISDPLPRQTEFVEASGNYTLTTEGGKTVVKWRLMDNQQGPIGFVPTLAPQETDLPKDLYAEYGFPPPTTPQEMTPQENERWKNYAMPFAVKAGRLLDVDVGLLGMWAWMETEFHTFASNCGGIKNNPNLYCDPDTQWQMGYGVQVQDRLRDLPEAFSAMHQGEAPADVWKKLLENSATRGINGPITQPSTTFPNMSIEQLTQSALSGDQNSRWFAAQLMKDDAIGIYLIAKTFKGYLGNGLAQRMISWDPSYYNSPKIINYVAGIYKAGITPLAETGAGILKVFNFTLTLKPLAEDIVVSNTAIAGVVGGGSSITTHVADSTDFVTLFTGQGRNTTIMGDEESFLANAIKNGGRFNFDQKQQEVRKIYKNAVEKNVNPLIILTLWVEEGGAGPNNGLPFGCDPYRKKSLGFDANLECAIDTLDFWMKNFQQNKNADGTVSLASNLGKKCVYEDEFIYAAEKYGPVCAAYDQNDYYHTNMVKYFRMLLGR